jgi:hypothetical protein
LQQSGFEFIHREIPAEWGIPRLQVKGVAYSFSLSTPFRDHSTAKHGGGIEHGIDELLLGPVRRESSQGGSVREIVEPLLTFNMCGTTV